MKNVAGDGYKYPQRTAENAFQIIRSRQRKYISLRAKEIDLVFRIAEKSCKADRNVILYYHREYHRQFVISRSALINLWK